MGPKVCAAKPRGKNKGIKALIEQGAIYGGKFSPVWGADKKGRNLVLVLRDEGNEVLAAPVESASKAKPSPLHIKVPRGRPLTFSATVLLDQACSLNKKLLDRKVGELPSDLLAAVTVAAFRGRV